MKKTSQRRHKIEYYKPENGPVMNNSDNKLRYALHETKGDIFVPLTMFLMDSC